MKSIFGTNNAYVYSLTISGALTEQVSDAINTPANVGGITIGIKQKTGACPFKIQVTMSTPDEINADTAEWFDWEDTEGLDAEGFLDSPTFQGWIPTPSATRFVLKEANAGTSVYFSVRAQ